LQPTQTVSNWVGNVGKVSKIPVVVDDDLIGRRSVMASRLTMYTTTWCGYCVRLKKGLERAGVDFDEVNIEHDPRAEEFVLAVNGGLATVPTLVLANGDVMTNPPLPRLLEAVQAA
jgi:mycoredoxin